uniref:Uncharacterized protein n=1 Tax=viral metagenome TaxID=1070528 RepID=A0A6M3LKK9_9ZZZZ
MKLEKNILCECGENKFWWFGSYLRCPKCHTEFKQTGAKGKEQFWQRRFNKISHEYNKNWEHLSL